MTSVACIGECMIELRHVDDDSLALGFGGDTLNTAVYLARYAGAVGATVHYVTALGQDPYSDAMVRQWEAEGIGTDLVQRLEGRLPGLYFIRTDDDGERSFTYYRSAAAAREMFAAGAAATLSAQLTGFDWLYLSAVSVSILDEQSRRVLWAALDRARAGGTRVAFDSNYRPAGWPDAAAARAAVRATLRRVDLALPSLDDEQALFGDADAAGCAARLQRLGVAEVVVKQGHHGCLVSADGSRQRVPTVAGRAVDTTAAGDAFNAGYLAARIGGADAAAAAACGHRLAGAVVGHPGAIIPIGVTPPLQLGVSAAAPRREDHGGAGARQP